MVSFYNLIQGLFKIPQLKDHTGFYLLKQGVEKDVERLLDEAISPKRTRKIVAIFDELSDVLCRVADMVFSFVFSFILKGVFLFFWWSFID